MKCRYCDDERIFFTIMPTISKGIGWSSHVITDVDGHLGLYHYQCGGVAIDDIYNLFVETMNESERVKS